MAKKNKSKRNTNTLRFWCLGDDGSFEIIEFPSILKWDYINTFGLLKPQSKFEIKKWLLSRDV